MRNFTSSVKYLIFRVYDYSFKTLIHNVPRPFLCMFVTYIKNDHLLFIQSKLSIRKKIIGSTENGIVPRGRVLARCSRLESHKIISDDSKHLKKEADIKVEAKSLETTVFLFFLFKEMKYRSSNECYTQARSIVTRCIQKHSIAFSVCFRKKRFIFSPAEKSLETNNINIEFDVLSST